MLRRPHKLLNSGLDSARTMLSPPPSLNTLIVNLGSAPEFISDCSEFTSSPRTSNRRCSEHQFQWNCTGWYNPLFKRRSVPVYNYLHPELHRHRACRAETSG